ncbi:MAG: 4-hydroxythreonine-4-phosphate dehydrogenase PdxA [Flavobacteriaceae bacterium]|nr:4-hydroxythreonine-4-phosphate dehydrogenase PdxA [Flavobacteriaceae bacterium]
MSDISLPTVGISCGDPNGIGIEVILKTLEDSRILKSFTPIIFCNNKLLSEQMNSLSIKLDYVKISSSKKIVSGKINVINVWDHFFETDYGNPTADSGKVSYLSLKASVESLKSNDIDVLVTAPINKNNIQNKEFEFPGHTDFLARELDGNSLMFMITENLKIGLLTDHIPLKSVYSQITEERIQQKISLINSSLKQDFGITKPKIAILSIDPHVGDGGVIGSDDDEILKPTLVEMSKSGDLIFGPFSSDSFFGSDQYKKYDAVLAIYHDQGLIPFKTISFGEGVNYTAGLKKIRTSPDHGTGYDIAGKGIADHNSFKNAIFSALDILKNRKLYTALKGNPLTIKN